MPENVRITITMIIHLTILSLAIIIPNIDTVFEFVGTVACACVTFIFPALGYLMALHRFGSERRKEKLRGAPNQIFASSGMQHQALLRRQAGCSARCVPPPARSISNHNVSLEMDGSLSSGQYGQQSRNDTSRVVTTDHRNQGSLENEASQYERHTNASSNTLAHENNVNNPFVERGEIFRVPVSDDEVIRRRISIEGAREIISQSSNEVQTYSLADTYCLNNSQDNSNLPSSAWKSVQMNASSAEAVDQTNAYELGSYTSAPSERSLHSGSVLNDALYIFGGYSGNQRLNVSISVV